MTAKKQVGKPAGSVGRDPRARFVDLANKRVTSAILQLRLIGNLSNRKNYEYDADDAKKIVRTLQRELDDLKARFKGEDSDDSSIFSL
jgi:ABC-type Fe3+-hydroxamate transport system substrate-binding protein